jgi:protein-disulfide isomerase
VTRLRATRIALGLAVSLLAAGAWASVADPQADDMALGNPKAKVTVIEYASVGCPHCAAWNNDVYPSFRAKYVDPGKVRFVLREMTTGDAAVAAAGFMLARCAGPSRYFEIVDQIYKRQASMYEPGASRGDVLAGVAKEAGLSDDAFQTCIDSQANLDALNARVARHVKADNVTVTPTFFINGKPLGEGDTLADFDKAIAAASKRR